MADQETFTVRVNVQREHWKCPQMCGGTMEATLVQADVHPPLSVHRCSKKSCAHHEVSATRYPRDIFVEESDLDRVVTEADADERSREMATHEGDIAELQRKVSDLEEQIAGLGER